MVVETDRATTSPSSPVESRTRGPLGWFALTVIVGMQAGIIFRPLGTAGETRVADWVDLLVPFAVLGTATVILYRARANATNWAVFATGAVAFALGHGLHLSANSISNADDFALEEADIVHLWDEIVSHYIWYTGLFIVLVAIALALRAVPLVIGPGIILAAVLVTVTLVNTYIEGGVPWLGLCFLSAGLAAGLAWRPAPAASLLLLVSGLGLVLLIGWGIAWYIADGTLFPVFSDVGWI